MNRGTATAPQLTSLRELRQQITAEADTLDDLIIDHSGDMRAFEAHVMAQEMSKVLTEIRTMVNIMLDVRDEA